MSLYGKAIVASGHALVSQAAEQVLQNGGNAFDAVVAAGFASAVVEPALTSLGGGGLLVGHSVQKGQNLFFDFFVDTPGRGNKSEVTDLDFYPVTVNFSNSSQDFNVGLGSVAVPGILKGLLHTHKRLGYMDLVDIVAPAKQFAHAHILNQQQAHFLELLYPIMTMTSRGRNIYEPSGRYLRAGNELHNTEIMQFFDRLVAEGDDCFYRGDIADQIVKEMKEEGGLLTGEDLAEFKVAERPPLSVDYRGNQFLTASKPSMGGTLIGLSLALTESVGNGAYRWGTADYLQNSVSVMMEVERLRDHGVDSAAALKRSIGNDQPYIAPETDLRLFSRGTTHVSVADRDGNCASMTCSNGEGSGYFAPGTGVMLNNMMGEDDLHPDGFHTSPPGVRVFSMMSPALLTKDNNIQMVIGSGGSKRIRAAVTQVLTQVVDCKRGLQEAVDAPRMYLDDDCLQVEPGFPAEVVAELEKLVKVNLWEQKDVYFGGVHAVIPGVEGAGDPRRGGSVIEVLYND